LRRLRLTRQRFQSAFGVQAGHAQPQQPVGFDAALDLDRQKIFRQRTGAATRLQIIRRVQRDRLQLPANKPPAVAFTFFGS